MCVLVRNTNTRDEKIHLEKPGSGMPLVGAVSPTVATKLGAGGNSAWPDLAGILKVFKEFDRSGVDQNRSDSVFDKQLCGWAA